MNRLPIAFLTAGAFLTVASCSSDNANLGDGQNAVGSSGGSAGSQGGETKDAGSPTGSGGSSNTTGSGGSSSTTGSGGSASGTGGSGVGMAGGPISVDSGSGDATGALTWRITCGDPVCRVPPVSDPDSGVASCATTMMEGAPCTTAGATCDPHGNCNQKLTCADHRLDVMCPRSNREVKQDIRYLDGQDLQSLADEVAKVRLTTYTYREPSLGNDRHLGFIIEDNPASPAVYPNQQHVDLYGYTSMAVAALQVQDKQLRAQEAEMADLRRELGSLRDELRAAHKASCQP